MILANGTIRTMDETMPTASALAIAGGRILGGVDSREDAIASHHHEHVNLQGATVVPGFVDAHVHFAGWALERERVQLQTADTFDDLLAAVEAHAAGRAADGWVLGAGWRDTVVAHDGTSLTEALTAAAGGRPLALVSKDGHALLTNELALDRLDIPLADLIAGHRVAPGDAALVGLDANGHFTGVLRETAAWEVRSALPTDDLTMKVLATAMREASRRGITSLQDMDGSAAFARWQQLDNERGLSLRVWNHLLADDLDHAVQLGLRAGFGTERLRIGGIKIFADGTLGSGTAWLHEPELSGPRGTAPRSGVTLTDVDAIAIMAERAAAAGFPLLIHAIGDAAVSAAVNALEATYPLWRGLTIAPRIEHAQLVRTADIDRCAELGIALSVQPTHLVEDRDLVDECWGSARAANAFAFRSMVDAGCGLLLGSDAPIEDLNPLAALHAATARAGGAHGLAPARRGEAGWNPEQALTPEIALLASTAWPADALGLSAELGRLLPGRRADLVALSDDPLTTPFADIRIVATMVGGRWTSGSANFA